MLLILILKGLRFFGFFFGGLTNGCSVSSFFIFLGSWKVGWLGGTTHPPSFHNSQNSGLWKIFGNGTNRSLWHNAFHQKCFRIFNEIHLCFILRMHWQNKVLPYWVFWRWFCDELNKNWRMLSFWVGREMIMFIFWVGYEWWLGGRRYPTTIYCAFLRVKKIRCLRKLSAGRVITSALSIKAIVIAFIAIALVVNFINLCKVYYL